MDRMRDHARERRVTDAEVISEQRKFRYRSDLEANRAKRRAEYAANAASRREAKRIWREENPDKSNSQARAYRERNKHRVRAKKYGLSEEALLAMLTAQEFKCANLACAVDISEDYRVDHDHVCCPYGESCGTCVRGLLCHHCNSGAGMLKDDPVRLRALADYLEAANAKLSVRSKG